MSRKCILTTHPTTPGSIQTTKNKTLPSTTPYFPLEDIFRIQDSSSILLPKSLMMRIGNAGHQYQESPKIPSTSFSIQIVWRYPIVSFSFSIVKQSQICSLERSSKHITKQIKLVIKSLPILCRRPLRSDSSHNQKILRKLASFRQLQCNNNKLETGLNIRQQSTCINALLLPISHLQHCHQSVLNRS